MGKGAECGWNGMGGWMDAGAKCKCMGEGGSMWYKKHPRNTPKRQPWKHVVTQLEYLCFGRKGKKLT